MCVIADWHKIGFMRATIERFDPSSSDIKKIDDSKKKIDDMNNYDNVEEATYVS